MRFKSLSLVAAVLVWGTPVSAFSQSGEAFKDPSGKFQISLMSEWRPVSYSDAAGRPRTEFIYRDRREGLLKITKEAITGGSLENMVRSEEENLKTYRPGFERASTEPFTSGLLRGLRFSFYTLDNGRQVANTYYYLESGGSVWVLRFVGRRGSLDANRNVTDQMARSFQAIQ